MTTAIEISHLTKIYRGQKSNVGSKKALDDVSLTVPKGSFFGLLGSNGAGKSTMINILADTVTKTSGTVAICGYNIDTHRQDASMAIGVVPQELILDPFFPVAETLDYYAGYYGLNAKARRKRIPEIIEAVGLSEKSNAPARSLSGGMRRRLLVAKALVHDPEVLVLDEPTAGVDIELRVQLWDYVRKLNQQGTTILLTTHYLEEAEELCDHIAVINHGKVIANDSKANLLKLLDQKNLVITPTEPVHELPKPLEKYEAHCTEDGRISIHYKTSDTCVEDILKELQKSKLNIKDLSTEEADLEDIFRHLTRKQPL